MSDRPGAMKALYWARVHRQVCPKCEAPVDGRTYCFQCRRDRALAISGRRCSLTPLPSSAVSAHPST